MKHFLRSLIMSSIAGVLVTSAIVVAQVPGFQPTPLTTTVQVKVDVKNAKKTVEKAEVERAPVGVKAGAFAKIGALARPANLDNLVQQYMRQARPLVRAELLFARKICELDVEHFRRLYQDTETAFKGVMTKFAEAQQQPRLRVAGKVQRPQALDGIALLHEAVESVMKNDLTPDQFARYRAEVEKRDAFEKQAAVRYLVDAIDRDLYLSDEQRLKLAESLSSHWDPSWKTALEYLLYANRFFPAGIDPYVTPFLDASQKKIWEGAQRVGGLGGAFGLLGSFMNDMDALAPELGEEEKAEPRNARVKAFGASAPAAKK
jgi:hypothetical protein